MLEENEIVQVAKKGISKDSKDLIIKQLVDENRTLREQLAQKDQYIYQLEQQQNTNHDFVSSMYQQTPFSPPQNHVCYIKFLSFF
jgi:hypothetical protein